MLLSKVVTHFFGRNPPAGVDLGSGPFKLGESFGRKEIIEVFAFRV
jgi:hypothetical protein